MLIGVVSKSGGNAFRIQMDAAVFWGEHLRFAVNNAIDLEGPSLNHTLSFLNPGTP
jgi:hypothetical protein